VNARKFLIKKVTAPEMAVLLVVVGFFTSATWTLAEPPQIVWEQVYIDDPPTSSFVYSLNAAAFAGETFVAVGDSIMTSTNGLDWTYVVPATRQTLNSITYGAGLFVAVGGAYVSLHQAGLHYSAIVTSTDGYHWTNVVERNLGFNLAAVTYGSNQFVAVGTGGGGVMVSSNGFDWLQMPAEVLRYCNDVAFGNGKYVLVGNGVVSPFEGVQVMTSEDGLQWVKQQTGYSDELIGVCYGNGHFIACGSNGSVLASDDGVTWVRKWNQPEVNLWRVAYGEGYYLCPQSTQALLVGTSGGEWTSQALPGTAKDLGGVAFGNEQFIAVGWHNLIVRGRVPAQPPAITGYSFTSDQQFALKLGVQSSRSYRVEFSGDLVTWNTLTNLTALAPTLEIRDAVATNSSRRFYRAVAQ